MNESSEILNKILHDVKYSVIHIAIFSIFFNLILFASPIYMLQIYNRILPTRGEETLIWLTILIILLLTTMAAVDAARHIMFVRLAGRFERRISKHLLSRALKRRAQSSQSGRSNVILEIDQIRSLLSRGHLLHLFDAMLFPIFIFGIALFHPLLAVIAVIGGVLLVLIAMANHTFVGRTMEDARFHAMRALNQADEMMRKASVVQALGMKPALMRHWSCLRHNAVSTHMDASDHFGIVSALSKAVRMLIQSTMLGAGAYLAIQDAISAGAIVAASILAGRALGPIEASISAWQELVKARSSLAELLALMDQDESTTNSLMLLRCRGRIEVEGLSCSIDGHKILRDVNFDAESGQIIAILGPSGCGKTTLIRHLIGSWSGTSGFVRLDDIDVTRLPDDARRTHIGYLPQDIELLEGSIVETISRFGTPEPEDIVETAQLAGIHRMVLHLPDGYGTRVGADGHRLSGGQRQRLALARALYGNPSLVVLDEPSSHLDEHGEQQMIETIGELKSRGTTLFIATHKANFVRLADRILVINGKGEVRFGCPHDLFRPSLKAVPRPISVQQVRP